MHVLTVDHVGRHLPQLTELTDVMKSRVEEPGTGDAYYDESLKGKVIGLFFAEPSTRTKASFQSAIKRLGGEFVDIPTDWSSVKKGETLEDTITTMSYYFDALVIRLGRPIEQNFHCSKPVINAGDGCSEHPTQALLDVYTINKRFKEPYNLCITGDLEKSRVVRSLVKMLVQYSSVRPKNLYYLGTQIPDDLVSYGRQISIEDLKHGSISDDLDILYMTRMQQERGSHYSPPFIIGTELKLESLKGSAVIMHPLPRQAEIPSHVDHDPRAIYFREQVPNGMYMRMALLFWLLKMKNT